MIVGIIVFQKWGESKNLQFAPHKMKLLIFSKKVIRLPIHKLSSMTKSYLSAMYIHSSA